jgi:hypothetical protein
MILKQPTLWFFIFVSRPFATLSTYRPGENPSRTGSSAPMGGKSVTTGRDLGAGVSTVRRASARGVGDSCLIAPDTTLTAIGAKMLVNTSEAT